MSQPWTVKAWAGAYSWTTTDDAAAGYGLAGPLSITTSLPDTDLAPMVQANPSGATFRVIVATAADLGQLQLGDPVTLRYWPSRTPASSDAALVSFAGRVSTLESEPHDLGMLFTVGCTDYTVDLAELPVGTVAYPQETLDARVRRIFAEAGIPVGAASTDLYGGTATIPIQSTIAARPIGPTDALSLLTHTLEQYRMEFTGFPAAVGVARLFPQVSPSPGLFSSGPAAPIATVPFLVLSTFRTPGYVAPLRVTLSAGVYLLVGSTATGGAAGVTVVDAGRVDMATKFAQRKGDGTNAVQVNSDAFTPQLVRWTPVAQQVTASLDTELVNAGDGAALALVYLPPVNPSAAVLWVADAFRWLIDQEPGTWVVPQLGRGFMVARIKGTWSPLLRSWYVGMLSAVTFTVDGGVPSAVVTTSPWNANPASASNPVKWSDLPAPMTYTNMSTVDTFIDYGLAGI